MRERVMINKRERKKRRKKKERNKVLNSTVYFSNVDCEAIIARITLKLGSLLSFIDYKCISVNKSACMERKKSL